MLNVPKFKIGDVIKPTSPRFEHWNDTHHYYIRGLINDCYLIYDDEGNKADYSIEMIDENFELDVIYRKRKRFEEDLAKVLEEKCR